jgi:uncharacterized protein (UPF0212 family)
MRVDAVANKDNLVAIVLSVSVFAESQGNHLNKTAREGLQLLELCVLFSGKVTPSI